MSRFLTPSKATLILLIGVYLEGKVPEASTVPVLSFLVSHVLPSKARSQEPPTLDDFERFLSKHQSAITGRTLWDLLLKRLWDLGSADTYHAFFDDLHKMQATPKPPQDLDEPEEGESQPGLIKLSRISPLGAFVRRAQVEFTRLTFGDSMLLWKDFVAFRQPSFYASKKRNAALGTSIDDNLVGVGNGHLQDIIYDDLDKPRSGVPLHSTDDVDRLLDFQIAEMTRTGHRVPEEVEQKLAIMMKSQISMSSAVYYVKFLDAWKAGDYPTALDSLHRYFDYTIQTREKSHYQYALLNMALLHAHFGCHAEAISAMQETVTTARENKDMACLNYSLSWLFHFGQQHPEEAKEIQKSGVLGSGKEALAFLRVKAKESSNWSLLSSTFVAEARLSILNGDGAALAVENIVRASHINLTQHNPAGFAGQMAIEAVLWTRLGVSTLAETKNETFLECHSDASTDQERLGAVCRMAHTLSTRGKYKDALNLMETVPFAAARSLKTQAVWSTQTGILKLQHALLRNDLTAADHYLTQLQAIPNVDGDQSTAIAILHIELLIIRDDLTAAMALLESESKKLDLQQCDIANRVKFMVLKAKIWDTAGKPQKAFSVAIRACSIAYEARILLGLWPALIALCRVLNSLSEFEAVRDLLASCMPQILTTPERDVSADAYAVLVDAQMGMAGKAAAGSHKRKEEMTKSLEYLDRAFDGYSALQDVRRQGEMMAKRAMMLHLSGDYVLANDYAAKYLDIMEQSREDSAI